MNPICKACGNEFPPRRGSAPNVFCSRKCSIGRQGKRLTQAERLERAERRERTARPAGFDPGMVAFLIAMIGLCLEHASHTCECWRAMALRWLAERDVRGVEAWA